MRFSFFKSLEKKRKNLKSGILFYIYLHKNESKHILKKEEKEEMKVGS